MPYTYRQLLNELKTMSETELDKEVDVNLEQDFEWDENGIVGMNFWEGFVYFYSPDA